MVRAQFVRACREASRVRPSVPLAIAVAALAAPAGAQTAAQTGEGAVELPAIVVETEAEAAARTGATMTPTESASATKTATPLVETPQAVSVVPRVQFEAQGVSLVSEALRYTPGVLAESNGYDIRYDWLEIRGFNASGYMWLDGLRLPGDPSSYATPAIDPFTLERVEVLKGPSSALYGQTIPGGLVNLVSKRPQDVAAHEAFVEVSAFGGFRAGFDLTGPLGDDGRLSYRLIGLGQDLGTQVDHERDRRGLLAPSLTWRPDERTTLTGYAYLQRDRDDFSPRFYPAYGTLLPNPAGRIPRDLFLGDPNADDFDRDPGVLLLDEPTSALDLARRHLILEEVQGLAREGRIVIAVLHDIAAAARWADAVAVLAEGRLDAFGPPADTITPDMLARVYKVAARVEPCSRGRLQIMTDGARVPETSGALSR